MLSDAAEALGAATPFFGLLIVACLLLAYRKSIRRLMETADRVRIGNVIDIEATKAAVASAPTGKLVPADRLAAVAQRLDREAGRLRGLRLLWVDDQPHNNSRERRILRGFGVEVVNARSTRDAMALLEQDEFDLIITDIEREDQKAGLEMAIEVRRRGIQTPIVGYVLNVDLSRPCPIGFRALVSPVDELLHQVMDVAARRVEVTLR